VQHYFAALDGKLAGPMRATLKIFVSGIF